MVDIEPLRALRYEPRVAGPLQAVIAPPYDVIDEVLRARLAAQSPYNVVEIDLPRANGGDPYQHAGLTFAAWQRSGALVRDPEPALWVLEQDFTAPDGQRRTRRGFFCRVRITDYGQGRIRPHERTHPGPKQDRLRLTRATRANLSPVFSLFAEEGATWQALAPAVGERPDAEAADAQGTVHRLWRVGEQASIAALRQRLADRELLIADGHHRYETARAYAGEVGGEGAHQYVLMFLCSLADPGLAAFATHRLLSGIDGASQPQLWDTLQRLFAVEEVVRERLVPEPGPLPAFGYLDRFERRAYRLTLKDQTIADAALSGRPPAYRRLDTAVLEAVVLRGALGRSEEDIARQRGLAYSSDIAEARDTVERGAADAAFFLRPTPLEWVRAAAQAGVAMPPKSTYFYPKIPTGLLFNPLD